MLHCSRGSREVLLGRIDLAPWRVRRAFCRKWPGSQSRSATRTTASVDLLAQQCATNQVRRDRCLRQLRLARRAKPRARIGIEPEPMHVVVDRLAQARREEVVVAAGRIVERDLVLGERALRRADLDTEQ